MAYSVYYYLVRYCLQIFNKSGTIQVYRHKIYCWVYLESFLVTSNISNWMNYFYISEEAGEWKWWDLSSSSPVDEEGKEE